MSPMVIIRFVHGRSHITHRDGESSGRRTRSGLGNDGASTVQVACHHHPVDYQAHCHQEWKDREEEQTRHGAHCLAGHLDAGHCNLQAGTHTEAGYSTGQTPECYALERMTNRIDTRTAPGLI